MCLHSVWQLLLYVQLVDNNDLVDDEDRLEVLSRDRKVGCNGFGGEILLKKGNLVH